MARLPASPAPAMQMRAQNAAHPPGASPRMAASHAALPLRHHGGGRRRAIPGSLAGPRRQGRPQPL
eukprot:7561573-Lingulodinium_polyedra.AAC.1